MNSNIRRVPANTLCFLCYLLFKRPIRSRRRELECIDWFVISLTFRYNRVNSCMSLLSCTRYQQTMPGCLDDQRRAGVHVEAILVQSAAVLLLHTPQCSGWAVGGVQRSKVAACLLTWMKRNTFNRLQHESSKGFLCTMDSCTHVQPPSVSSDFT